MQMTWHMVFEQVAVHLLHPNPVSAPQKPFFLPHPASCPDLCLPQPQVVWGSLCSRPYSGPSSHFSLNHLWISDSLGKLRINGDKTPGGEQLSDMHSNAHWTRIAAMEPTSHSDQQGSFQLPE